MSYTLFISDLHLEEENPKLTTVFLDFLKNHAGKTESLYILGDLFEVWIGDDDDTPFNQLIISALRAFSKSGSRLYFLPGNRDFLIGKKFCERAGCKLLSDPSMIELYGKPILLTHGDSLCTQDKKHMAFRKKTRNFFFKKFILFKSLKKRRELAKRIRQISKNHTQKSQDYLMDVTFSEIPVLLDKYHLATLIHGHTHRPSIEYFRHHSQWACRIVLSDWDKEAHALRYDRSNKYLMEFP
ncbi:MAG: UDP-2,3-diacylglucosamine diphosphatase [Gammaproteobacteria bacterium RIFCSPLOWO2_02_FULL_38_11]|nr:MAG: UDP-2,3-diacylglucosamine diphosphatase [Gammaproteobacteria bacterium RIFCSPLOWO2_02_FULL_38_11]